MTSITFLSVEDVLRIHERALARDGGLAGIRDLGLLTSAVMTPQQAFGGAHLHEDFAAMAGAYLFHLANNHPFLDGNKRVALAAALVFLLANGVTINASEDDVADVTLRVASGRLSKPDLAAWLRAAITPA